MKVRFWGVRGSVPAPLNRKEFTKRLDRVLELAAAADISTPEARHKFLESLALRDSALLGGNTPCVEVRANNTLFVFDMGTGLRELGDFICRLPEYKDGYVFHIFIGHTHWDHIQGFPFFMPAYNPKVTIHFHFCHEDLEKRLNDQQDDRFFPVSLEFMKSNKIYHKHTPGETFEIDGVVVKIVELNHPGKAFGYRLEHNSRSFVYASDSEYNNLPPHKINTYIEFYRDADLLIFDAPYSFDQELERINWGHSSALVGVDIGVKANIKKLGIFHHAPENDDDQTFKLLETAVEYQKENYPEAPLRLVLAREGDIHEV